MADLSCFATKKNADDGKWFPVKIDGNKVPLAILIYGSDSDVVQDFERKRIRKLGIGKKGKTDIDEEAIEELIESQDEAVIVRIGGISSYDWRKKTNTEEPVVLDGKEIKNNKADYAYLLENFPSLKDFINEKSNTRSNFLD